MKTLITIALLVSALAAGAKTSTPAGWTDDYDAALKRAAAEKKLVLADPIKSFGSHEVKAKLGFEVVATVFVAVYEEK